MVAVGANMFSRSKSLCASSSRQKADPCDVASGRARFVTSPACIGSTPVMKTIGIVAVAAFATGADGHATCGHNHRDPATDQIGAPSPAVARS